MTAVNEQESKVLKYIVTYTGIPPKVSRTSINESNYFMSRPACLPLRFSAGLKEIYMKRDILFFRTIIYNSYVDSYIRSTLLI